MQSSTFIRILLREVFQSETSAWLHADRTAKQLGNVPPARPLQRVSSQAKANLRTMAELVAGRPYPESRIGQNVGRAFSLLRHYVGDRMLSKEKTYRGTLLGMHHGVDAVKLLLSAAEAQGESEIATFCRRWLRKREPLVTECTEAMAWFGKHPEAACEPVEESLFLGGLRKVLTLRTDRRQREAERAAA